MPLNLAQMPKSSSPDSEMTLDNQSPGWKALFRVPGFPFFFVAMLVSLFGTGMNFAGVTLYVGLRTPSKDSAPAGAPPAPGKHHDQDDADEGT